MNNPCWILRNLLNLCSNEAFSVLSTFQAQALPRINKANRSYTDFFIFLLKVAIQIIQSTLIPLEC
jgi:hypothetical protein